MYLVKLCYGSESCSYEIAITYCDSEDDAKEVCASIHEFLIEKKQTSRYYSEIEYIPKYENTPVFHKMIKLRVERDL